MKKLILCLCLISLALLPSVVFAGGEDWADQMGDIMTGKGNTYACGEVLKEISLNKPILGLDKIQAGVYTKIEMGETAVDKRYIEGGPVVRMIW